MLELPLLSRLGLPLPAMGLLLWMGPISTHYSTVMEGERLCTCVSCGGVCILINAHHYILVLCVCVCVCMCYPVWPINRLSTSCLLPSHFTRMCRWRMAYLECCDIGFDREDLLYTLCSLNLRQLVHSDTHEEENKPVIKFLVGLIHSFPDLWLLRGFFPFAFTTSFWAPMGLYFSRFD